MKAIQYNPYIIDSLSCFLNILWVIDLYLVLFNTSRGIYSIPEESKYATNNETQCVPLLFLSSRFIIYASSFILGKLFLGKTILNLDS